jgi:hypothetical protein
MFGFVTGVSRWSYRVLAYLLLLTDAYPPFSLEGSPVPPASIAPRPSF